MCSLLLLTVTTFSSNTRITYVYITETLPRRQNRPLTVSGTDSRTCTSWKARRSPWTHCWGAYWFLLVPAPRRWCARPSHPPRPPESVLLGPPLRYPTPEARGRAWCLVGLLTDRIVSASGAVSLSHVHNFTWGEERGNCAGSLFRILPPDRSFLCSYADTGNAAASRAVGITAIKVNNTGSAKK